MIQFSRKNSTTAPLYSFLSYFNFETVQTSMAQLHPRVP